MSGKLIKTLMSPAIFLLITVFAIFSVSANTTDEVNTTAIDNVSTIDEQEKKDSDDRVLPTMKPSYITAPGEVYEEQAVTQQETVAETFATENIMDIPNATHATGATSFVASDDNPATPVEATVDTVPSGVVQTSDTSMSVVILIGLISLCCIVIGIHKKKLTE